LEVFGAYYGHLESTYVKVRNISKFVTEIDLASRINNIEIYKRVRRVTGSPTCGLCSLQPYSSPW
jgi:hypothetical protein